MRGLKEILTNTTDADRDKVDRAQARVSRAADTSMERVGGRGRGGVILQDTLLLLHTLQTLYSVCPCKLESAFTTYTKCHSSVEAL